MFTHCHIGTYYCIIYIIYVLLYRVKIKSLEVQNFRSSESNLYIMYYLWIGQYLKKLNVHNNNLYILNNIFIIIL